ncbi:ABC transporter substrate-binding protein [Streptomyces sp. PTM05]|uniref:ABC transporter substrate-binding protein n=1 Tax=Streptantibioticus parmotrematis TaxID=2873249 RepID=A0ABS7QUC3_9ACTN|nr:ABC transporter substrate-binding protein [Streptantibioticus parmotrematis]MBY8886806.1 ABC transporter substrate-binding protein [Streptantibioticus parmotrematis]
MSATLLSRPDAASLRTDAEFRRITAELTRRGFLGGLATSAALVGLAGCGTSTGHGGAPASGGPWSFTDDRGTRVDLPARPKRVAFLTDSVTAALWAAGVRPVAAFDSGQGIVPAVGLNLAADKSVIQIGNKDNELDTEALVSARPDLLIDAIQADGTLQTLSGNPKIKDLAPVVGIDMYQPVEHIVGQADRLTTALGATPADAAAHRAYQAAQAKLRAAVAANPGLRVGFVFDLGPNGIGVMNPATWAVLKTVKALGMKLVPVAGGKDNTYSQAVSWENVTGIPADLMVWAVSDPLPTEPVWKRVPAVAAGQLWKPDIRSWYAYSWANFATLLEGLAEHVASAKPGVGPKGSVA